MKTTWACSRVGFSLSGPQMGITERSEVIPEFPTYLFYLQNIPAQRNPKYRIISWKEIAPDTPLIKQVQRNPFRQFIPYSSTQIKNLKLWRWYYNVIHYLNSSTYPVRAASLNKQSAIQIIFYIQRNGNQVIEILFENIIVIPVSPAHFPFPYSKKRPALNPGLNVSLRWTAKSEITPPILGPNLKPWALISPATNTNNSKKIFFMINKDKLWIIIKSVRLSNYN